MVKLGEHYVLSFGQKLIKLQYDAVEIFFFIQTGVISKLSRVVPAK